MHLSPGTRVLDLGSGSGEMLCTWARDHGIVGTGVDMSKLFSGQALQRAEELGVAHQVSFVHNDAAGYGSETKVDVAACVGAAWIGGGIAGTIELLSKSLTDNGYAYWRAILASATPYGRCCQGMLRELDYGLPASSRSYRAFH